MAETVNLKPCPFCGSAMTRYTGDAYMHPNLERGALCIADSISFFRRDAVKVAAWNRRPPDPAVAELVEALRRALPSVQSDAEMMAAIDRHNPLPAADMPAVTKAANELDVLVDNIRALLAKHAAKP